MREEDLWPAMHAYRKAVAAGDAPAVKCHSCDIELVPVVSNSGRPALKCYSCREVAEPGQRVWEQIASNISEVAEMLLRSRVEY